MEILNEIVGIEVEKKYGHRKNHDWKGFDKQGRALPVYDTVKHLHTAVHFNWLASPVSRTASPILYRASMNSCLHHNHLFMYIKDFVIQFLPIIPPLFFALICLTTWFMLLFGCFIITSISACLNLNYHFSLWSQTLTMWVTFLIHIVSQQALWLF